MRFSRFVTSFAASVLAACATPLRPDPSVDLTGDWRVTAVNGMAVPPGMSGFGFRYQPPFSLASLGCNSGSGPARVANGWLVTGDGWIMTTARCSEERMRFSRYELFSEPLAIEAADGDRVQLRNARGSLSLQREWVPQLAGTRWRVVSINGVPPPTGGAISFTPSSYDANFGCNDVSGGYRQEGDRFEVLMSRQTEKECLSVAPSGLSVSTFEDWGARILWSRGVTIRTAGPGLLRLESPKGAILLQRKR